FYPDEPWEIDSLYRYRMKSTSGGQCQTGTEDFICGANGLALQTDLLVNPEDVGGPNMDIYFRGGEALDTVFTPLRNLPIRDTNSNYVVDCDALGSQDCLEPFDHEVDPNDASEFLPSANAAKLKSAGNATILLMSTPARVGCPTNGDECPENKFIYQTYGLNTEVIGPYIDPDSGEQTGVRVLLYPTMLATTSTSVYLRIAGLITLEEPTGPQILRMRYNTETSEDNPQGLVEGVIVENDDGQTEFRTEARLQLDAPL
ncbi:unnamed protein product, partial [Laminaria digitata]